MFRGLQNKKVEILCVKCRNLYPVKSAQSLLCQNWQCQRRRVDLYTFLKVEGSVILFPKGATGSETMVLLIKMISFISSMCPYIGKY